MPRNQFDININMRGFPEAQAHIRKTKDGMDRMRISTSGLKRSIGALRNNMLLYAFTIGAISRVTGKLIESYRKQIQAESLLTNNLKNMSGMSKDAAGNLMELAASLQQVTTHGDEEIIMAQSLLATFQLTEDTIAQLTPRVLDMADAMGTDLRSAAILLGKAFVGETSRLKQIGLVIDEFALAAAKAKGPLAEAAFLLKTLDNNFKGASQAIRDTPLGELDGMTLTLGDFEEQLGRTAIPLETLLVKTKLFVSESLVSWAFFFEEFGSMSSDSFLGFTHSMNKANKRMRSLSGDSTKAIKEAGAAQTNSYDKQRLSLEALAEEVDKNIEGLDKKIASTRSEIFASYGATEATVAQVRAQRLLTVEELKRVNTLSKLEDQLETRKRLEEVFSSTLSETSEAQREKIQLTMAEIFRDGELLGTKEDVKIVLAELKKAYEELDPVLQANLKKKKEEKESLDSSIDGLIDEHNQLKANIAAMDGRNLASQRAISLNRVLSKEEKKLIGLIEDSSDIVSRRTRLQSAFDSALGKNTEHKQDQIRLTMAEITLDGELFGSKEEIAIVLAELKKAYEELDPVIQKRIEDDEIYKNSIEASEEALNSELTALMSQMDALNGADLAHLKSIELKRTLTKTEEDLVAAIEMYQDALAGLAEEQEAQNTLQSTFNRILDNTTKGEIKRLKTLILEIEANNELIATDRERVLVLEELKNKIAELEEEEPLKDMALNSSQIANGILAASRAMVALRDNTEMTKGEMMQMIGSLMMLAPGGQIPGAIVQGLGMFVGHTGGLIKNDGIQRFATGGMVQGQDNVPIMAQAGEFIMQRSAVQNIGVENLADMNRSGQGGGVTVNIQGNMIGNDEFVRDTLIPQLSKASSQGLA